MADSLRCSSVLITGSSRGLGLEFVKQLIRLPDPPLHIFATCRSPQSSSAHELQFLASRNSNLHVFQLDVNEGPQIREVAAKVGELVGETGLNLLINNAGILNEGRIEEVTDEDMLEHFRTNAVAPLMVAQTFLPLLRAAVKCNVSTVPKSAIINISSRAGSATEEIFSKLPNNLVAYRVSKAALNTITRSLSVEVASEGVLAIAITPGFVQTDLNTKRGLTAGIAPKDAVSGMLQVIVSLDHTKSGSFLDLEGNVIPW